MVVKKMVEYLSGKCPQAVLRTTTWEMVYVVGLRCLAFGGGSSLAKIFAGHFLIFSCYQGLPNLATSEFDLHCALRFALSPENKKPAQAKLELGTLKNSL